MDAIQFVQPLYSFSGFAVGLLVGLTGVGGGSLMTPILILLFGIHPASAVGTDLLYAAATKTAGSLVHGYNRTVDWRVVRRLATGSVPATALTILALSFVNLNGAMARDLICRSLDRCAVFYGSDPRVPGPDRPALFGADRSVVGAAGRRADHRRRRHSRRAGIDLFGGGGRDRRHGAILLYPQLPIARIVGSDIAHAVPLTLVAGLGHWWLGSIDLHLLIPLLLGSVPGIVLGSYVVTRVPEVALRLLLAGTLVVVATKLALDTYSAPGAVMTATTSRAPH